MRILILEDNIERIEQFRENLGDSTIKVVDTVSEAIYALSTELWDALFLDHDLGGKSHVDPALEATGYHVAQWLEQHPDRQPATIVIHSMNYAGATKMKMCLPSAIIAPGAWKTAQVQ